MDNGDHDLLIQIATDTKWMKDTIVEHMKEDSALFAKVEAIADAAYKRVDTVHSDLVEKVDKAKESINTKFNGLLISGVLSIVVLAITLFIRK